MIGNQWKWPVRTAISSRKQIWVSRLSLQSLHGDLHGDRRTWDDRWDAWSWGEDQEFFLLGGDWNHDIIYDFPHLGNVIIPTDSYYIILHIYILYLFLGSYLLGGKRGSLILKFDFSPFLVDNLRGPAAGGLVFFLRAGPFGSD